MDGAELRRRRTALGLTQTLLGERLGVGLRTIQEWESDLRPIRPMVDLALQALEHGAS
jgi:transcriptional regulator with XRE-family HTH domain